MNRVWITGASSGIGEQVAYQYAREGAELVLTASSPAKLETVAAHCRELGANGVILAAYDLGQPEGISDLTRQAWNAYHGLDVAFLNAGISQRTRVEDTSMEMVRKIMEINYFAPVAIAKELLTLFSSENTASKSLLHIAVTTSIAGLFGFPLRCAYSSSKHALYGFFETLQAENYDKNLRVTIVCPGRVNTPISLRALDKGGKPHGVMDEGQSNGLSADRAARQIVRAIRKSKREVYIGKGELIMVYIKRFFPGLCAWIGRHVSAT